MRYDYGSYLREVQDFPEKGVTFLDIAPLIGSGAVFRALTEDMAELVPDSTNKIVAFDARVFIFGGAVAAHLGVGLVMLRKPGKLPGDVYKASYDLEYGSNTLELQHGVLVEGDRVTVIDDVVATAGTALAGLGLVRDTKARVDLFLGVVDIPKLGGSDRIKDSGVDFRSIVEVGS